MSQLVVDYQNFENADAAFIADTLAIRANLRLAALALLAALIVLAVRHYGLHRQMQASGGAAAALPSEDEQGQTLSLEGEGPALYLTGTQATDAIDIESDHLLLNTMTIAPELRGTADVVRELARSGVRVSLGHSVATAAEARAAARGGACGATHLFNAMAPLHHREAGLAGQLLIQAVERKG